MIYIECKADLILTKSITTIPSKEICHAGNKSGVCKKLQRYRKCTGLVDEDPQGTSPSYMKKLNRENLCKHDLKILHDNNSDNRLIILCPRLEEWILKTAKEASIDVRKYDLPNDGKKLHRQININLNKFEKLMDGLKNKNPERLRILKRLLEL
jgi:hypothetical protein